MNTIIQGIRAYARNKLDLKKCVIKVLSHHEKCRYFAWYLSCFKDTLLKLSFLFIFKSPQLSLYFDFINIIYVVKRYCKKEIGLWLCNSKIN